MRSQLRYLPFCLQDTDVTWNTTRPDFTPCFQHSVLTAVPCGFLFLFAGPYCFSYRNSQSSAIKHNALNITRTVSRNNSTTTRRCNLLIFFFVFLITSKLIHLVFESIARVALTISGISFIQFHIFIGQ